MDKLLIRRLTGIILVAIIFVSSFSGSLKAVEDPVARQLLDIILSKQPQPYGFPGSTFNYQWAQFMMTVVAAQQNGYITRDEALARIGGLLSLIEQLPKYHGFVYDGYNSYTLQPTAKFVYFQGWYLYSLIVVKNAYPELAVRCENLLNQVDYTGSDMYDPSSRSLRWGRYDLGTVPDPSFNEWLWPLRQDPGAEVRMGYVAYTYLTGDKSPWLLDGEPVFNMLYGYSIPHVWHNMNFDLVLQHNQFPEFGYYKQSWEELVPATQRYMADNGMSFFPVREEPLESFWGQGPWPDTQHREAMTWLTWYFDSSAPVMEKAFVNNYGISRYYDNWNFYWTFGTNLSMHPKKIGNTDAVSNGYFIFPFRIAPLDNSVTPVNPAVLKKVAFFASYDAGNIPSSDMIVELNGNEIGRVNPGAISTSPTRIEFNNINGELFNEDNYICLRNSDASLGKTYSIYSYENNYRFVKYRYPAINSVIDNMDSLSADLEYMNDSNSRGTIDSIPGYSGNALRINYDFRKGGSWLLIAKDCGDIDTTAGNAVQFWYRYPAGGGQVDFEVQLQDLDGTIFGKHFYGFGHADSWTQLTIPFANFQYLWGGEDRSLDRSRIKSIRFAINKTTDNTSGAIDIDDLKVNNNFGVQTELVPGAAMEITVDGQRNGEENCMAFLTRVAVAHNYYVYSNLLNDPRFIDSLVGWVGVHTNQMSLAPYVHNVAGGTLPVAYERPSGWVKDSLIRVTNVTPTPPVDVTSTATIGSGVVNWPALSRNTYKIEYIAGSISGKVTVVGRAANNNSGLVRFELKRNGQSVGTYDITTAADGSYALNDIEIGTYYLTAKGSNSLRAKISNVIVSAGQVTSNTNFSLKGGDANNDNSIGTADMSLLRSAWLKKVGDPNWDTKYKCADFNNDGSIGTADMSILSNNWLKQGDN